MFRLLLTLSLFIAPTSAFAQAVLDVHGVATRSIPLALPPVDGSPDLQAIAQRMHTRLADAMDFHGAFTPLTTGLIDDGLPPDRFRASAWKASGAELLLRTRLRSDQQLVFDVFLYDVVAATVIASRRFRGTNPDALADAAADAVIEALLQQPGPFGHPIAVQYRPPGEKWREIYRTDWHGAPPVAMTSGFRLALQPAWLPGTRDLVVVGYPRRRPALLYVPANGALRTLLESTGNLHGPAAVAGKVWFAWDVDGNTDLYEIDLATGKRTRRTTHPAADLSPAPSPDGSQVAFVSDRLGNPYLFLLDVETGETRPLLVNGAYIGEPAWSPDGRWIAIVHRDRAGKTRIAVVRPDNGRASFVTEVLDDTVESPSWGADSRTILFSRLGDKGYDIWKTDRATAKLRRITAFSGDARMPAWHID